MGNKSSKSKSAKTQPPTQDLITKYEKEWLITWDANITNTWLRLHITKLCTDLNYEPNTGPTMLINFIDSLHSNGLIPNKL